MQILEERIRSEARHLGKGIVKVDSFMNHQIDPLLMREIGKEFASLFRHLKPSRILTAETSGIAPSVAAGMFLEIPIVFARKHQPVTMAEEPYREISTSPTHKKEVELLVSSEYLSKDDRVLIIDDFLASAKTIRALVNLVNQSGAVLTGVGAVIEKLYGGGRMLLNDLSVPIESLAVIERCDGDRIILCKR